MYEDAFIDIVRKSAYPIDAPEGPDYERAVVRGLLEAIALVKSHKDPTKPTETVQAARDEARRVFDECMKASF